MASTCLCTAFQAHLPQDGEDYCGEIWHPDCKSGMEISERARSDQSACQSWFCQFACAIAICPVWVLAHGSRSVDAHRGALSLGNDEVHQLKNLKSCGIGKMIVCSVSLSICISWPILSSMSIAYPTFMAFICIFPKYGICLKFCKSLHVVTRFIASWDVRILAHSAYIYAYTSCVMPVVCFLCTYSYFIFCSVSHCLTFDHTLSKR